jgi:CRP/FNR family transcriptional regulator, nitrogen oxide reductase regulator
MCTRLQNVAAGPFLDGLKDEARVAVLSQARRQRFNFGCTIISGGDKATHLFLVNSGTAKYFRLSRTGEEVLLKLLATGDVFGLGTLLKSPWAYIGSAEATSECHVLVWAREPLRRLAVSYPQLAENALRIVLEHLRNFTDRHVGLVTQTAEQRLARTLLTLGQTNGSLRPTGVEVRATNAQLGALADVSHFTASRLLNVWQRKGTVQKHRGKVLIRAPESLLMD